MKNDKPTHATWGSSDSTATLNNNQSERSEMFCHQICRSSVEDVSDEIKEKIETFIKLFDTVHDGNDIAMKVRGTKDQHWILDLSLTDLIKKLHDGDIKAVDALIAYQAKAIEVHKKTNCVVSWVEGAYERAKELDNNKIELRGPLHGVPFSVKEMYDIEGTYSTGGLAKFTKEEYIAKDNSKVVKMLRNLGAVPFCKTNIPQAMISMQCSNNIFGVTTNPHGDGRECGGSSGGEGALVGGGGSILGVGNDIGGSLRNPAAFNGCYTLKPSPKRGLSQWGTRNATGAHPIGIRPVGGFLTRSAGDLVKAYKTVWGCDTIPWRQECYDDKPRIGYFVTDGILEPASGCKRAVVEAVERLKTAGFYPKEINPPDMYKVMEYYRGIILSEIDSNTLKENLSGELVDSTLKGLMKIVTWLRLPKCMQSVFRHLEPQVYPQRSVYNNVSKLGRKISELRVFTAAYLSYLEREEVDIVLCPAQLLPAPPTGVLGDLNAVISPYVAWNAMKCPAGVAPITVWSIQDDTDMNSYKTHNYEQKRIKEYSKGAIGLPLGVQVWCSSKSLYIMILINC